MIELYFSTYTDARGQKVWSIIYREQPLCAATPNKSSVLNTLKRLFPNVDATSLPIWDGDNGAFIPGA